MLTMLTLLRVVDKRNKPNLPISAFLLCFCTLVLAGNLASLRDQEAQRPKSKNAYSCQTTFKRNGIKVTKNALFLIEFYSLHTLILMNDYTDYQVPSQVLLYVSRVFLFFMSYCIKQSFFFLIFSKF